MIYDLAGMARYMTWSDRYSIWFSLASMLWYMVWPGEPCMVCSMACQASHGTVWPGRHYMIYGMAWQASNGIWLKPGRQGIGLGIVYGIAWRARNGVW